MKNAWWVSAKELNGEQRDVITLPPDGSYLVTGPPGCGKTNLLVLRANYLTMRAHANILVLVFTRTLQEFIRSGAEQYAFPNSSVVTSRFWERSLLREYGYDPDVQGTFSEQRIELLARMNEMVNVKRLGHIYDAIFLDEAQDYLADEIELFRRLTPRLFAVADSRQRIYDVDDPIETLKRLTDKYCPLKYHYRCGRKICLAADSLRRGDYTYEPLEETFQYEETARPSTVDSNKCSSLDEVTGLVLERLRVQLQAYPGELLGVVAPRRDDAEYMGQRLLASELRASCVVQTDTDYISFGANTSVCVCSLHAAKGLEFRTVHLVGAEGFPSFRDKQKRMSYTAITRAKTSLNLYSIDPLPGYLAQAVYDANPRPDPPDLDAVFLGKR
jgi:superfamily I DNA and RNA helicase